MDPTAHPAEEAPTGHGPSAHPIRLPHRPSAAVKPAVPSRYNIRVPLRGDKELAYNSLTGSFAMWEADDLATFARIEAGDLKVGSPEADPFVRMGYAVPEETDELLELESRYNEFRANPSGMVLTIAPTLACNFACDYCFQGLDKPTDCMTEEVQDKLVAFVKEESKYFRSLHITWYGGEPLLAMSAIRRMSAQMIDWCNQKKRGYTGFIVTNGYKLNQKIAEELLSLKVTNAQVTVDGAAHDHDQRRPLVSGRGTYQTLVENMEAVVKNTEMMITLRINIDSRNRAGIEGLLDDLAARGVGCRKNFAVYFAPVEGITDSCASAQHEAMGKTAYGKLEAELTKYAMDRGLTGAPKPPTFLGMCVAARPRGLVAVPNGDLHKCWDTVMFHEMRIGTLDDPKSLDENTLHHRWLAWTPFGNPVCRACKIVPNCSGMCAYKFVHPDHTHGEAGALPCPSWKFNMAERLFLRAEAAGMVKKDDWDPVRSPTTPEMVGANHTLASVAAAMPHVGDARGKLPPGAIRC